MEPPLLGKRGSAWLWKGAAKAFGGAVPVAEAGLLEKREELPPPKKAPVKGSDAGGRAEKLEGAVQVLL